MQRAPSWILFLLMFAGCSGGADERALGSANVPSELSGESMGAGFHLRWRDNSAEEEEFVIEQRVGSVAYAELSRVPFNTTQYMVESGQTGTEHRFRVRAKLPAGLSDPSNEVMWMPTGANVTADSGTQPDAGSDAGVVGDGGVTTPGVPSLVSATVVSHGTVALAWQNPASTCATLEINRKSNGGAYSVTKSVSGELTSAQDSPGHASGTFCYTMTCKLNALASSPSNEKCVTQ